MNNYLNLQKYNTLFLSVILLSSLLNYKVLYGFRIVDLLVVIFLLININFFKIKDIIVLLYTFTSLLFSFFIGLNIIDQNIFYLEKIAIIYKIIMPLSLLLLLKNIDIIEFNKKIFFYLINILFLFLIVHIFYFKISLVLDFHINLFDFNINNYSFPFTSSYTWRGDKHILSALLLVIGITNLIFFKDKYLIFFNIMINFILIYLLDSTLYTIFFCLFLFYFFGRKIYLKYFINLKIELIIITALSIMFVFSLINIAQNNLIFENLLKYLNNFNIGNLSDSRIDSIEIYTSASILSFLFGGDYYQPPFYYDSGLFVILNALGFLNVIIIIIFLYNIFKNKLLIQENESQILFMIIIFSNLFVTEFFLTSRYVIPVIIIFYLFCSKNLNPQKNSIEIRI